LGPLIVCCRCRQTSGFLHVLSAPQWPLLLHGICLPRSFYAATISEALAEALELDEEEPREYALSDVPERARVDIVRI
jgi:hypothetical protein